MILGADTGMRTFGWALLDERRCRFVDLGVVIAEQDDDTPVTLDRARRMVPQSRLLAEKAPGCSMIVVEQMSFPGGKPCRICKRRSGAKEIVPIALSWGVITGVVATIKPRPRLLTIAPQRWQREVLPGARDEDDYEELALQAGAHVLERHPDVHDAFLAIPAQHRNHAIDAAMIALVGALRPHRCTVVTT